MKKFFSWLKDPHGWGAVILFFICLGVMIGTTVYLAIGYEDADFAWLSYMLYLLAALSLGFSVYLIVRCSGSVRDWLKGHTPKSRLFHDYAFRTTVTSSASFLFNFAYALFQAVLAILSRSVWLGALAGYYGLLCFIRGGLLLRRKKNVGKDEDTVMLHSAVSYRNCGYFILLLTIVFSAAVVQMVLSDKSFRFQGLIIYFAALYAFYKIILASYNIVKARKQTDLTVRSLRNLNMADALVSILALQTAMFQAFGSENIQIEVFNGATGTVVCLLIAAIGIVMAINGSMKVRRMKAGKQEETKEE